MGSINRALNWVSRWKLPFQFLNVKEATDWLKSEGRGYHAQTMWHDVRAAFDEVYKKPLQLGLGPREYLKQSLFVEQDWRSPASYKYYGTTLFRDPATGDQYGEAYSVYADSSLTDAEVAEIVYAREEEMGEEYTAGREVIGFISATRYHKWGAPRSQGYGIAEL